MEFVTLVALVLFAKLTNAQVCSFVDTETIRVSYMNPVESTESYIGQCKKFWYNVHCIKFRTIIHNQLDFKEEIRTKLGHKCCTGYVQIGFTCTPVCETPCENGKCTSPNQCSCIAGYTNLNSTKCVPHCENCSDGQCVMPGVCHCNDGYHRSDVDDKCMPICNSACINGFCSEPSVCTCNEGFTQHNSSKDSDCSPKCDTGCHNGKCIAPNKCECNAGYQLREPRTMGDYLDIQCEPVCEKPCGHGICEEPNKCRCNDGYRPEVRESNSTHVLECKSCCANSNCTAPKVCNCLDGFDSSISNNSSCIPHCDNCSNGICRSPGVCICNSGYSWNGTRCSPICPNGCLNGECIEPDVCTCRPGYKSNSTSECKPVCEKSCANGQCTAPNVCTCAVGYEANAFDHICNAICIPACINSTCVSPNTCKCNAGYVNTKNSTFECLPQCETPCVNGECIAPNTCSKITTKSSLFPASNTYSTISNTIELESDRTTPLWSITDESNLTKESSFCDDKFSMPRTCTGGAYCNCYIGYSPCNSTHCMPKCSVACVNSDCGEPDVCLCREGYSEGYNETEWNVCYAQCGDSDNSNNGCLNGHCVAPDVCECYDGFEKRSDDAFKCVPCAEGHCQDRSAENRLGLETASSPMLLIIICVLIALSVVTAVSYFLYRRRRITSYPIDPIYINSSND